MVKFLIRVDWMNSRIELSPNLKVLSSGLKNEKTKLVLELDYKPNLKEYPVYSFTANEMEVEEVFDDDPDSLWWKAEMDVKPDGQSGAPATAAPAPTPAPAAPAPAPAAPAPAPAPTPAPAAPAPAPTPAPAAPAPAPAPAPAATAKPAPQEIAKLKAQLKQIQGIFTNLQNQAAQGKVTEQEFLQKQQVLGGQMGKIMAELDKWGEPYDL